VEEERSRAGAAGRRRERGAKPGRVGLGSGLGLTAGVGGVCLLTAHPLGISSA
jgi:hypothetical protein